MHWRARVTVTSNGTGADFLTVTLPADVSGSNRLMGVGNREGDGTPSFFRNAANKSTIYATVLTDGAYPASDGTAISFAGSYEID